MPEKHIGRTQLSPTTKTQSIMTPEEKKLTPWERSRLDSMPWEKWSEKFGISEMDIIGKGLGKDLAQGRYTGLIRVYSSGDGIKQDGDASLRAYQTSKDGEFQLEVQGVRENLYLKNIFGKDIPQEMQQALAERGSAGPLDLNQRQQYIAVNPVTKALVVCPASTLENELQRRTEVFGYTLTDDDKAALAMGGVLHDVEMKYNGQTRKGDIHFDAFRQSLWAVDPKFPEKIGLKKESSKELSQTQAVKAEQKAQKSEKESASKSRGVHL